MDVRHAINSLKKANDFDSFDLIVKKISSSELIGTTQADSKDLNNCVTSIFEKLQNSIKFDSQQSLFLDILRKNSPCHKEKRQKSSHT